MILLLATFQSQVPQVNFWYIYHPVLCQSAVSFTSTGWCFNRLQCKHYRWSERFSPAQKGHLPPQQIFPNIRLDFFFFSKSLAPASKFGGGGYFIVFTCVWRVYSYPKSIRAYYIHMCVMWSMPHFHVEMHVGIIWFECFHQHHEKLLFLIIFFRIFKNK